MTAYVFTSHPYPARVEFVPTKSAWRALMRRLAIPDEPYPDTSGRCTQLVHASHPDLILITFSPEADTRHSTEVIGLMAHEIVHAVQYLEQSTGSRFDSETQAYLTQALLQWLMNSYAAAGRTFKDSTP